MPCSRPSSRTCNPGEYYDSLGDGNATFNVEFNDIDEKINFLQFMTKLAQPETENFVLDFGNDHAYGATDLNRDDFTLLLAKPVGGISVILPDQRLIFCMGSE